MIKVLIILIISTNAIGSGNGPIKTRSLKYPKFGKNVDRYKTKKTISRMIHFFFIILTPF